jgi:hypothetical protein
MDRKPKPYLRTRDLLIGLTTTKRKRMKMMVLIVSASIVMNLWHPPVFFECFGVREDSGSHGPITENVSSNHGFGSHHCPPA